MTTPSPITTVRDAPGPKHRHGHPTGYDMAVELDGTTILTVDDIEPPFSYELD